jgi:AraC family transcriptional regulator
VRKDIVGTTLWMIETAHDRPVTAEEIARAVGVSVFHLTRAFTTAIGMPPARYHRLRRLSEAAKALVGSDDRIVDVALSAGYGSQEAFTRAFTTAFSVTPAAVRGGKHVPKDLIQEAIVMPTTATTTIKSPRSATAPKRRIVGLAAHYSFETNGGIPGQWTTFLKHAAEQDLPLTGPTFGVCYDSADNGNFAHLTGIETTRPVAPRGFTSVVIPAGCYAVFTHRGPAATLRGTVGAIWGDYLPNSDLCIAKGPDFELYPAEYDPADPEGRVEIWVPVAEWTRNATQQSESRN